MLQWQLRAAPSLPSPPLLAHMLAVVTHINTLLFTLSPMCVSCWALTGPHSFSQVAPVRLKSVKTHPHLDKLKRVLLRLTGGRVTAGFVRGWVINTSLQGKTVPAVLTDSSGESLVATDSLRFSLKALQDLRMKENRLNS